VAAQETFVSEHVPCIPLLKNRPRFPNRLYRFGYRDLEDDSNFSSTTDSDVSSTDDSLYDSDSSVSDTSSRTSNYSLTSGVENLQRIENLQRSEIARA
jgi:hypothetical protein